MKRFFFWLFQLPIQIGLQALGVMMVRFLTSDFQKLDTPEGKAALADRHLDLDMLSQSVFFMHFTIGMMILVAHYAWVSPRRLHNPRLAAMPIWVFFSFLLLFTLSFCTRQMSMPTITPSDNPQAHVSPTGKIIVR